MEETKSGLVNLQAESKAAVSSKRNFR